MTALSPALSAVRRAARRRVAAEKAFREAVLEAHGGKESLRAIGEAAGLSHVRILQIVRGHLTTATGAEGHGQG